MLACQVSKMQHQWKTWVYSDTLALFDYESLQFEVISIPNLSSFSKNVK